MSIVSGVLARVFVDDIDLALPIYQRLSGDDAPRRFQFRDVDLAWVGPFLLLNVPTDQRADYARVATLLVESMDDAVSAVESTGGTVLEGPSPLPTARA